MRRSFVIRGEEFRVENNWRFEGTAVYDLCHYNEAQQTWVIVGSGNTIKACNEQAQAFMQDMHKKPIAYYVSYPFGVDIYKVTDEKIWACGRWSLTEPMRIYKYKVRHTKRGRAYILVHRRRIHLDQCLRTNLAA